MGQILENMFDTALQAMTDSSLEKLKLLDEQDEQINIYLQAIRSYVNDVSQGKLSSVEARHAAEVRKIGGKARGRGLNVRSVHQGAHDGDPGEYDEHGHGPRDGPREWRQEHVLII